MNGMDSEEVNGRLNGMTKMQVIYLHLINEDSVVSVDRIKGVRKRVDLKDQGKRGECK